jgi:DNA adenine methylase
MKVKIGNLEITVETLDELDELVKRYGNASIETSPQTGDGHKPNVTGAGGKQVGSKPADGVVLQKLIDAGTNGVPTNVLGEILGKRGKGARGALRIWSKRVGLSSDDNLDVFEDCRSGTQRGIRLKSSFHDVAKSLQATFADTLAAIADEQKPETESTGAKPFVKWVGGKRSVLPELLRRMPEQYGTYRECFVGGGALFFAVQPERAYLSDINFHLILAYQAVQNDLDRLITNLKTHERLHNKEYFSRARERLSREDDPTKIASLMIYLNKTCFNGLYRVNKAGGFNVPIGDYKETVLFDEDVLRSDSKALQGVTITHLEFSQTPVAREDFYYFDPPYHKTYDGYNGNGFDDKEHENLAEFCREVHAAKAYFMLSNSDTPFVRSLYKGFTIEQISASRSVSCKGDQRKKENELLIRNY